METPKGSPKVPAKATPIEMAIKKYNVTDAAVTKLKKRCMEIKVIDHGDKKGYALAHDTRIEVKGIRVQIEKTRVELNKEALAYRNAINGEAKRLTGLVAPLEEYLIEQEKIVEDEKERVKAEKAERLKDRIKGRVNLLLAHGMVYDGVDNYTFLHFGITNMEVAGHGDDVFDMFVKNLKAAFTGEQERLAKVEEDRLKAEQDKKDEDARIKKEQDDEAERLTVQKKEQEDAAAKIKTDQEKIDAGKKEVADLRYKSRVQILVSSGMVIDKTEIVDVFILKYIQNSEEFSLTICHEDIHNMDDSAFKAYIERVKKAKLAKDKRKEEEAAETKLALEKKAKDDAAAEAVKEKEEKETKEKQAEKDEALRKELLPDNEKLNSLADLLQSCHRPSLTHKHSHGRLEKAWKLIIEACVILRGGKKDGK